MNIQEVEALEGEPTAILLNRPGMEPSGRPGVLYGLSQDKKHVYINWDSDDFISSVPVELLERIIPNVFGSNGPLIAYEPDVLAALKEFRDDDAGYLSWLVAHPDGYVINIARTYNTAAARVHRAGCRTVGGQNPVGGGWTGPYVKVCAEQLVQLQRWVLHQFGAAGEITPCGTCRPAAGTPRSKSAKPTEQAALPVPEGRWYLHGPAANNPVVTAWADDYIRFEHRPPLQEHLRDEIRSRCRELKPAAGQVLHATFFGPKYPNADVENLVLYYIDSFTIAGRNGIRFEHGAAVPLTPDDAEYRFCYRYALAPQTGALAYWQQGRTLASFDWTNLGAFAGDKKLAQVWLALGRGEAEVFEPAAPATPFAVKVQLRPPLGHQPVWGGMVKGIFDGVICAFQAHTDAKVLPEVVARLATMVRAEPTEIEQQLLDRRRAVLGAVQKLVSPYRAGVKWDPSDHLCVAGELLPAEPVDSTWAIKGEVVELFR